MLPQKDCETKASKCVTWNYCITYHFLSSIVEENAGWVILNKHDIMQLDFAALLIIVTFQES